jgi:dynein heavy chain, axonemal
MLIDDVDIAAWTDQNLPSDRMSIENATILINCDRWPLLIDPQLQGLKWIKTRYGDSLKVIRLGQKGYLEKIEKALSMGDVLLIEYIEESIEAVLDPLIGRNTIKKGEIKLICFLKYSWVFRRFRIIIRNFLAIFKFRNFLISK